MNLDLIRFRLFGKDMDYKMLAFLEETRPFGDKILETRRNLDPKLSFKAYLRRTWAKAMCGELVRCKSDAQLTKIAMELENIGITHASMVKELVDEYRRVHDLFDRYGDLIELVRKDPERYSDVVDGEIVDAASILEKYRRDRLCVYVIENFCTKYGFDYDPVRRLLRHLLTDDVNSNRTFCKK